MLWEEFYERFWDWSDSTRRSRISSLESIGSGEELFEAVFMIDDPKVRAQLVRKAMKLGVELTRDDYAEFEGTIEDELYVQLGQYCGYDSENPWLDEDNMTWEDFYCDFSDWNETDLRRRIEKLRHFGDAEEVAEAIEWMPNGELERLLRNKALAAGVVFETEEEDREEFAVYDMDKVVDVDILDIESGFSKKIVNYVQTFANGRKKTLRKDVLKLGGYYDGLFSAKPIVAAEFITKAYCGVLGTKVRLLFAVRLVDGSAELIQCMQGSKECRELLLLSDEGKYYDWEEDEALSEDEAEVEYAPVQPYRLGKNELPQGEYRVGRDIPPGTYDFQVIYGSRGKFEIGRRDDNGHWLPGESDFYWVGLRESYEQRELIHVSCKEGCLLKISGNVVLKISKSDKVMIEL